MNVIKTKKKKKKQLKHKPWWDKTMRDLHIRTCLAYIKYRDLDFSPTAKKEWEEAKKEFKKTRKFNQKLLRDRLLKQINELLKLNKQDFWSRIKRMMSKKQTINIKIDKIKEEFESQFTKCYESHHETEVDMQNKLKELITRNDKTFNDYRLKKEDLEQIIKELPNGKSTGISGISNELIKYGISERLLESLKIMFEKMIQCSSVPYLFNVAIIKPLIKSGKKSSEDINNIRPVSFILQLTINVVR